jgi:hypothetical protein
MKDHQSPVADKPAPRRPWKRASSLAPSRRCGRATFGRSEPSCRLRAGGAISRRSISRSTVSCGAATWSGGRAIAPPQLGVDTSRGRVRSEVSTLKCRRLVVLSHVAQVSGVLSKAIGSGGPLQFPQLTAACFFLRFSPAALGT